MVSSLCIAFIVSNFLLDSSFSPLLLTIYPTLKNFRTTSAYFKDKKHLGNGHFVTSAVFQKIYFLIWIKSVKNNFRLERIRPQPALLDYPSALMLIIGVLFSWSNKPFSKNNLNKLSQGLTQTFFLSGNRYVTHSKCNHYHKIKLSWWPDGHCDIMFWLL